MLKIKNKEGHKSRTVGEAIEDVKKKERAQITFDIDKDIRTQFLVKTKLNNSSVARELRNFIHSYLES